MHQITSRFQLFPRSPFQFFSKSTGYIFQKLGIERFIRNICSLFGYHFIKKHYYNPIPNKDEINAYPWSRYTDLPGLDMNDSLGLQFLDDVFPLYNREFRERFPNHKPSEKNKFYLINGGYMAIDAHVYYAFIRHFEPKRIVEIGAGNSTLLAAVACLHNGQETGQAPELIAIEPFPNTLLRQGFPGLTRLIEAKVQDVDMALFSSLKAGDILFIDSSHVLRAGGDVQYEYLEVLPRLADGVLVHIHDVSLPKAYPLVYFENQLYWNEQYLLQAFLTFNSRFEILWPGNYMMEKYPKKVCEVFPEFHVMRQSYPMSEPTAFWMRTRS